MLLILVSDLGRRIKRADGTTATVIQVYQGVVRYTEGPNTDEYGTVLNCDVVEFISDKLPQDSK